MADQNQLDKIQRIERDANVSLKEFFNAQLIALDRRTEQATKDAKDALNKASQALEKRLDLLNEFRAQSSDESKKYLLIKVYDEKHSAIQSRMDKTETAVSRLYGGIVAVGVIGVANLVKLWFAHG